MYFDTFPYDQSNLNLPSIDWEGGVFPHEASNDVGSTRDWSEKNVSFDIPWKSICENKRHGDGNGFNSDHENESLDKKLQHACILGENINEGGLNHRGCH